MIIPDGVGMSTGSTLGVNAVEVSKGRADDELSVSCVTFEVGNALGFEFSRKVLFIERSSDSLSGVGLLAND